MTCTKKCQNKNYLTQWSCHHYFKKYHGQVFKIKRWIFWCHKKKSWVDVILTTHCIVNSTLTCTCNTCISAIFFWRGYIYLLRDLPACLEGVNKYYYKLLLSRAILSCSPLGEMPNNSVWYRLCENTLFVFYNLHSFVCIIACMCSGYVVQSEHIPFCLSLIVKRVPGNIYSRL